MDKLRVTQAKRLNYEGKYKTIERERERERERKREKERRKPNIY